MELSPPTLWWIAAGVMVAVELLTGTLYLLMIALGLAAGAVAAHVAAPPVAQWIAAAAVGGATTIGWHIHRLKHAGTVMPASHDRGVNLDVGEHVHVVSWKPDRTTRVDHRGTQWTARLTPHARVAVGEHRVIAVEGNWLVLEPTTHAETMISNDQTEPTWKSPSSSR